MRRPGSHGGGVQEVTVARGNGADAGAEAALRPDSGAEATAGCRGEGGGCRRRRRRRLWSEAGAAAVGGGVAREPDSRLASDGKPSRPLRSWSLSAWKMKGLRLRSSGWWAAKWPNNLARGRLARDKLGQEKARDPVGNVGCQSRPISASIHVSGKNGAVRAPPLRHRPTRHLRVQPDNSQWRYVLLTCHSWGASISCLVVQHRCSYMFVYPLL